MARVQLCLFPCRCTVVLAFWLGSISTGHADLVAHWKLDEGDGDVFADSAGGNDGFLLDDTVFVEWVVDSPPTQEFAVQFSGDNSWIQTEFEGIGGSNPRTVAFWVKSTATNTHGIVGWGATADTEKWHIRINNNAGNGVLGAIRTEPQSGQNVATTPIDDGEWHHVASVFPEGATMISQVQHFVDGVFDPRSGGGEREVNTRIGPGAEPVTIGMRVQGPNRQFFPGLIADVRIYDEALDEAAIQSIMTGGGCFVRRAIGARHFSPGGQIAVTLEAQNLTGATTITDTFPAGLGVANDGGGTVAGNTIEFNLTADGMVSYTLSVPDVFCEDVVWSGTFEGAGDSCQGNVFGDSSLRCVGNRGIGIGENDWDNFVEVGPSTTFAFPEVVATTDGRTSLHMPAPNADRFIVYAINVTRLPDGVSRFPIQVEAREVADDTNGLGIRNLSIDPEADPSLQNSWIAILLNDSTGGRFPRAQDDLGGIDDVGTIGLSGRTVGDPTLDTTMNPPGFVITRNATLELQVGVNLLRIDATDPRDLPAYQPDTGWQAFEIRIGATEADLEGTVLRACSVGRTVSDTHYFSGDSVTVTLQARNISGDTTITETFSDGLAVGDDGGGMVSGNTIEFTLTADGMVSYTLTVPDDFCDEISLSGTFTGAGEFCEGNVFGRSAVACAFGCTEIREGGAVSEMLIIGPIDLGGNTGPQCDDNGNLGFTDYLRSADGSVNEANLEVVFGDEIEPDFLGAAGGVGVALAPNTAINPRAAEGILTVWIADANASGRINFNDADNLGTPLDDYVIYSVVYLDNTTGDALPVTLRVGSDDAVKVIVNGEQVWLNAVCRALPGVDASDPVAVVLEPGMNSVLIAVVERGSGTDVRLLVYDEFNSFPLDAGSVVACLAAEEPDIIPPGERFVRGDADANGSINLTDGIVILNFLFLGAGAPGCLDAADTDDDGGVNPTLTDAVIIFGWLFSGGPPPREPTPDAPNYAADRCGLDATPDDMDCATVASKCAP